MADKLLALVALAMLLGFLGIVVVFVPDPDLIFPGQAVAPLNQSLIGFALQMS